MNVDFSQPQRQSIVGIWVLFLYSLQQYARALWPIILIWFFKFDPINKEHLILGILVLFASVGLISYLKYLNFTFVLDPVNKEFIITDGVLNKTKTAIQLNKIQQVNINQSFIQKIIGVYELSVDTAASNKKEGTIKAISHDLALLLKSRLLENEAQENILKNQLHSLDQTEQKLPETAPVVLKISFFSLLKVGITSNYGRSLALILLFFNTIYESFIKFGNQEEANSEKIETYIDANLAIQSIVILLAFIFCIVLVVNIFRVVFKYYGYTITKQQGSLLLCFGLLNTKNTIIKPEKVQIVVITRNFFQKKIGIVQLKIKQAIGSSSVERKTVIEIPGCNALEHEAILKLIFKENPKKGLLLKPNFRKLGFSVFLTIGLPLFSFVLSGYWFYWAIFEYSYLVPVYVFFIGVIQFYRFKNNKLFINESFIIKQSGAWDISNEIIESSKIQAISTSQLFWHKNLNIGSVILHTAAGDIAFELGNFTTIKKHINHWLYEIETSNSNWM